MFCHVDIWEHAKHHMADSYTFHSCSFCTVSEISFHKDCGLQEFSLSKNLSRRFESAFFVTGEDDCVAFPRFFSPWWKYQAFHFAHCPFDLHVCIVLVSFNADMSPYTSFTQCVCFNSFVSGLKVSGSDLLIHASLYHGPQLFCGEVCFSISCSCNANTVSS